MTYGSRVKQDRPEVNTYRISHRLAPSAPRVLVGLCAVAFALASPAAFAQGRLDARYEATLSGIPVGSGGWTIDIADDQFSASAFGGTAGILKSFASGSGTTAAQGRAVNGAPVSSNYSAPTTTSKKNQATPAVLPNATPTHTATNPPP